MGHRFVWFGETDLEKVYQPGPGSGFLTIWAEDLDFWVFRGCLNIKCILLCPADSLLRMGHKERRAKQCPLNKYIHFVNTCQALQ
jgi:hypothetical protein